MVTVVMGGSSREALLGGLSSIVLVALFSHYTPNPYPHRLQGMAKEKGHAIKGGTFSGTITAGRSRREAHAMAITLELAPAAEALLSDLAEQDGQDKKRSCLLCWLPRWNTPPTSAK